MDLNVSPVKRQQTIMSATDGLQTSTALERPDTATLSTQWKSQETVSQSPNAASRWKSAYPLAAETPSMKATRSALLVVKEISVTCRCPEMKLMPHLPRRHL